MWLPGLFPLTATQKKARSKLRVSFDSTRLLQLQRLTTPPKLLRSRHSRRPESPTERLVASAWAKVLGGSAEAGAGSFLADEDFFQAGGDSLAALRVMRVLAANFGDQVCPTNREPVSRLVLLVPIAGLVNMSLALVSLS